MNSFKDRLLQVIENTEHKTRSIFANEIGVSKGNVTNWLNGNGKPTWKPLLKMNEIHKVNINWLLRGIGNPYIVIDSDLPKAAEPNKKEGLYNTINLPDLKPPCLVDLLKTVKKLPCDDIHKIIKRIRFWYKMNDIDIMCNGKNNKIISSDEVFNNSDK